MKVLADLMSAEGFFLVQMDVLLLYLHIVEKERALDSSFSYKGTNSIMGIPFMRNEDRTAGENANTLSIICYCCE